MKRRYSVGLALVFVTAIALLWAVWSAEPRHDGRTLSQWLIQAQHSDYPDELPTRITDSEAAVRAIGPRAVPTLMNMLRASDSSLKIIFAHLLDKQSVVKTDFNWAEQQHDRAIQGFRILGSAARPAIPELAAMVRASDQPYLALRALAFIGPEATPVFREALSHSNSAVRSSAASVLSDWQTNAAPLLPELLALRHDPEPSVAVFGLYYAVWFMPATSSVPILVSALDDPRPEMVRGAIVQLGQLGALGTNVEPALPRLAALHQQANDPAVRRAATNALRRIAVRR